MPKSTANARAGSHTSIGPGPTPNKDPSQPHWNTATKAPNAAAIERIFMAADMSGMTTLLKTTASISRDSPTITPRNTASFEVTALLKSMKLAVSPPMYTRRPVPAVTPGSVVARNWSTSSVVAADCGEAAGETVSVATAWASFALNCGETTAATSE